jgi:hypothetical protein
MGIRINHSSGAEIVTGWYSLRQRGLSGLLITGGLMAASPATSTVFPQSPVEFVNAFAHYYRAENCKAVYHGLAGQLLLKGAPGLLRLRVIAPPEQRIGAAQQRSESEA